MGVRGGSLYNEYNNYHLHPVWNQSGKQYELSTRLIPPFQYRSQHYEPPYKNLSQGPAGWSEILLYILQTNKFFKKFLYCFTKQTSPYIRQS